MPTLSPLEVLTLRTDLDARDPQYWIAQQDAEKDAAFQDEMRRG